MIILGIESSCDDTGVAVVDAQQDGSVVVRSNIITSQDHVATGGVVPEIAARHHTTAILPAIDRALAEARTPIDAVDCIAVTRGPGLIACLLVGVETAKTIAAARNIPIIGVNHMEGHVASTFVEHPHIQFPAIVLLVSGGHTMLVLMESRTHFRRVGNTRDDAAGEAFDKIAKMLELPYPGGPQIAAAAARGNSSAIDFPKPMMQSDDLDFSFAGLKTSVRYYLRDHQPISDQLRADVAASAQESIVQVLVAKTVRAVELYHAKTVVLGGGVSANRALQERLRTVVAQAFPETSVVIPAPGLFTDNGAMIAIAAAPRALAGDFDRWQSIVVDPNMRFGV